MTESEYEKYKFERTGGSAYLMVTTKYKTRWQTANQFRNELRQLSSQQVDLNEQKTIYLRARSAARAESFRYPERRLCICQSKSVRYRLILIYCFLLYQTSGYRTDQKRTRGQIPGRCF
ncbi:hypothetical protein CS542_03070 [Pedobacter sp. IW39]|nr:hypothetical protein CS542_03070 [Pedobacter sp. IW39]